MNSFASQDSPTRLELIVTELGPGSPDVESITTFGDSTWSVQFENDRVVHLTGRDAPSRLELMAPVALLPAHAQLDAMRALLMFNFLSMDTGGMRMSLSAQEDCVYLISDIAEADLSLLAVQATARGLAELAGKWASILAGLAEQPERSAISTQAETAHS